LANGQFEEAETILEQIHIAADLGGRILRLVEVYLLKALLAQASGHVPQAMTYLEEATLLSKSKGFVRIFVDEGTRMAKLLYEAVSYDFHTDFIQKLLAGFPEVVVKSRQPERLETPDGEYIEPLSDRELEVLQLMAEGLTNPEIGKRLFLSPNTVKAHSRTIYSKLGVNNRTQAVNRARALGIMADP
jgi:LuxR family maltose regulon positive regulatory protein